MSENVDDQLDGLMSDENKAQSAWVKMKTIGESVSGVLLSMTPEPAHDGYKEQIVYEIRKKDGSVVKTALARFKADGTDSSYYTKTRRWVPGDLVGIKLEKELPPMKPGHHPAKIYELFHKPGKPENVMERLNASSSDGF